MKLKHKPELGVGFLEFILVVALIIPVILSSLDFAFYFSTIQQTQRLAEELANASLKRCVFKGVLLDTCMTKLRDEELPLLLAQSFEDFSTKGSAHITASISDELGNDISQAISVDGLGKACEASCNEPTLSAMRNIRKTIPGFTGLSAAEVFYEYKPLIPGNPLITFFIGDMIAHGFALN